MALRFSHASEPARHAYVQWWSGKLLRLLSVELQMHGRVLEGPGLLISNHVSWLDIACLHAVCPRARFVSKSDVLRWPLLGWLIREAGTLFIERERKRDALRVVHQLVSAFRAQQLVAIFPEGTTGTGPALAPFHANLLQAPIASDTAVQPVVLRFHEPAQRFSTSAPYVGEQTLVASMWKIACADRLAVEVNFLAPRHPPPGVDRRSWAISLRNEMQGHLDPA